MSDKWILNAARDFRLGSERMGSPFEGGQFPLRSAVVTLVFSIELYLKYLAAQALVTPIKGHDLSSLFRALPQAMRDTVASHYAHNRPIVEVLDTYKDAFIEWRYIYEQQHAQFSLDMQSLRLICDALEATASSLK